MKYLKLNKKEYHDWQGGTLEYQFDLVGEPTIKELCADILSDKRAWGTIFIQERLYHWSGRDYQIQYFCGDYVDNKRNKVEFQLPDELKDRKVKKVYSYGAYNNMDYYVDIEFIDELVEL